MGCPIGALFLAIYAHQRVTASNAQLAARA
jgi:hypothetical protein